MYHVTFWAFAASCPHSSSNQPDLRRIQELKRIRLEVRAFRLSRSSAPVTSGIICRRDEKQLTDLEPKPRKSPNVSGT